MHKIGIIGGGSWGTALAKVASQNNENVVLWSRNRRVIDEINNDHINSTYLPGCHLAKSIKATTDFKAFADTEILLFVTPAQHFRTILEQCANIIPSWVPIVICSKGIERKTGLLMSEVANQYLPDNPCIILSGPNFAHEVAQNLPTATTIASKDREFGKLVVQAIGSRNFRPYFCDDPIGVQIAGALKNVYAIASGITYGKALGENARTALMTRSLAEMARLGIHLGADYKTFMGLAGVGDLTLTTNSPNSRNMRLGIAIGEGKSPEEFMEQSPSIFEGYYTSASVIDISKKFSVEMPVAESVYRLLHQGANIEKTMEALLTRPFVDETILSDKNLEKCS
jgi:glycerol-3-phosphate dehydrogenase (NAD(P)+)